MNSIKRDPFYILYYMAGFLILTLSAILFWQIRQTYYSLDERLDKRVEAYVNIANEGVKGYLMSLDSLLHHLSEELGVVYKHKSPEEMQVLLSRTVAPLRQLEGMELFYWGKDGRLVSTSDGNPEILKKKVNIRDREFFIRAKQAKHNEFIISEPVLGRARGKWIIVALHRVTDSKGNFSGVITASIPTALFERFFEKVMLDNNDFVGMYGDKNISIFNLYGNSEKKSGIKSSIDFTSLKFEGGKNILSKNAEYVSAFGKVGNFPIFIHIGLDRKFYFKGWHMQNIMLGFIFCFVTFISVYTLINYRKLYNKSQWQQVQMINSARLAALGETSAAIAHEINNPLAIISGYAQKIEDDKTLSPEGKRSAEKIITVVNRISKIVRGLRIISRHSSNEPFDAVNLSTIIETVIDLSKERLMAKGILLRYSPKQEAVVLGNSTQLMQVFLNLLNNSIDAIEGLKDRWISIDFEVKSNRVFISFRDSGKGISPDISEKIMKPFFTTKPAGHGSGLGLSISKTIIDKHSGVLRYVASEKNTCFMVELPAPIDKIEQSEAQV